MEGTSIAGLVFVIIVAAILFFAVEGRDARLKREAAAQIPPRPVAVIDEQSSLTGGGQICAVLLVVSVALSMALYSQANTVFQQIQAGVAMICGILLFGLGVAVLRKRTYKIFELTNAPPTLPVEAPEKPLHSWKA
ncbi:hypothetical protein ACFQZO_24365 [Bradyrhizobium sp. GCM10027634]|uniref:hypothetical protein n=1 Tax=unclassified Bradyrhizobium TaxID=2631580 RepID=UPI00263B7F5E|nr:hypothetical protein [Bradyrhizobium sp. WYCCWR 12677]MDN5003976.1 hypothetical protein [Bradyrhizobium sp. WYCCWR 12677]